MKHHDADITKHNKKKPIREDKPNSIGDGLKSNDKEGYPYPDKGGKQYKNQSEFINPKNNNSKNK